MSKKQMTREAGPRTTIITTITTPLVNAVADFLLCDASPVPDDPVNKNEWITKRDDQVVAVVACLEKVGLTQADLLQALGKLEPPPVWALEGAARDWVSGSNDELEIDDYPLASESDDGCWVSAWVWVQAPETTES